MSSKSPQSKRGSSQNHEKFARARTWTASDRSRSPEAKATRDAWKVKSDLNIEKSNKRADRV
jgi:hypothetical protein